MVAQSRSEGLKLTLIIMAIVVLMIFLFSFLYVRMLKFDFDQKRDALMTQISDLKEEIEALREGMDRKERMLIDVEREKRSVESALRDARDDNEELRAELTEKLNQLERKRKTLKKRIASLEGGSPLLMLREAAAKSTNPDVQRILQEAMQRVSLVEQGKPISLEPITVGGQVGGGTIVSFDRRNNLIVVDLGRKSGLSSGDRLSIMRDGGEIASAEVLSTRYLLSAAFIDQFSYGSSIRDIKESLKVYPEKA